MAKLLTEDYGNPSSKHRKGVDAEIYMKDARKKIAKTLKAQEAEILFTSGGTESNNLAVIGAAQANVRAGKHVITTAIEHASVANPFAYLADNGYEVTYLPVNEYGEISVAELAAAIRPDTVLVSVMHVNNEIGAIEPVAEAGKAIKAKNPGTVFHVDAIQSYGKLLIYPKKMNIDLLSVSGHKIHGPKGSGFLYVGEGTKIKPLLLGGGQQGGMRSGTENVPAIAGLGIAAEEAYTDFKEKQEHLYALREHFIRGLSGIDSASINGRTDRAAAPHIVSVSVKGVRSEILLHALEKRGIYISSGSACSSNSKKKVYSRTLQGIGLATELLDTTVRFSFCGDTTTEELDCALAALREEIPVLQKYTSY